MALEYPHIDPVAVKLGPIAIHWYGITYLVAFALFVFVLGVVIGGRLGYCLFYKPAYYAAHPLEVFYVWLGGMSSHGGMLGVIVSQWWYAHSRGKPFWQVM